MKNTSTGQCTLCGGSFGKVAMTRHVIKCKDAGPSAGTMVESFHIMVENAYSGPYWLLLAVPRKATLAQLDQFLRNIWLECCGHMSAFKIGQQRYAASPMKEYGERTMNVALGEVLETGTVVHYEYDYGSTTELKLKVISDQESKKQRDPVQLLARNAAPEIKCAECSGPATQICVECSCSGNGWLCDTCSESHECGEEMLLPAVNSPRVGVCGYAG